MEKLIITGVNGLLGQKVLEHAHGKYEILGIDLHDEPIQRKSKFSYRKLDLTMRKAVKELILGYHPHYLVHTAAMTDVDGCETQKELCWKVNVEATDNIAYAARKTGTKIVHLSSDYVFDGKSGPYSEADLSQPLGYYGKSKLASENILIAMEVEHATVRTMVLYGSALNVRPNFMTWLVEKLKKGEPVKIVTDQFGSPTLADDLAHAIIRIIEQQKWDLFHISGSEIIDRYNCALKIAEVFKLNKNLISSVTTPELSQTALRPLKSGFIITKAETELGIKMANVEDGLKRVRKQDRRFLFF